jgi:hypothetical protein
MGERKIGNEKLTLRNVHREQGASGDISTHADELHDGAGLREFIWRRCNVSGAIPGCEVNQGNGATHQTNIEVARVRSAARPG